MKISLSLSLLFVLMFSAFVFQQTHQPKKITPAQPRASVPSFTTVFNPSFSTISSIPLPNGYERIAVDEKSFSAWLRSVSLRKNNTVYLYNKQPKADQSLHYAVLDISTGYKDLQQCADALMRLKAEYLFSYSAYHQINFIAGDKTVFNFKEFAKGKRYALRGQRLSSYQSAADNSCYSHLCLMQFLDWVFSYCSTYTLQSQTKAITNFEEVMPGDMLVKAGSPGHAMMVGDVAVNSVTGNKIFLLVQGFMPAQDIHIVKNPNNPALGPWFEVSGSDKIITSGWVFEKSQLRKWYGGDKLIKFVHDNNRKTQ